MKIGFLVLAMSLLALTGCDGLAPIGAASTDYEQPKFGPSGAIRLQPGDKVKVTVFGEDRLSGEYEIDPGGSLSLPLAGTVEAAGLSKNELEQLLSKKFSASNYLLKPKVTVDIANFRPFYVLGEVEKPGRYPYDAGLNVLSAVAVAGGATYRASESRVLIQHVGEPALREYPMSPTIRVYPGDVIRVPERYF